MLLPGTEVEVLRLGPQHSPYNGRCGRVVQELPCGYYKVILDDDPIPRWRDMGVQCREDELRTLD